jgi:hypothetical protein
MERFIFLVFVFFVGFLFVLGYSNNRRKFNRAEKSKNESSKNRFLIFFLKDEKHAGEKKMFRGESHLLFLVVTRRLVTTVLNAPFPQAQKTSFLD